MARSMAEYVDDEAMNFMLEKEQLCLELENCLIEEFGKKDRANLKRDHGDTV